MKITYFLLVVFAIIFVACKEKKAVAETSLTVDIEQGVQNFPIFNWDTLRGVYHGKFSDKEININLTYVSEYNAVGYSVVSGLIRNLSGKVTQTLDSVKIILVEPGDHAHDGTFYLAISKENFGIVGRWEAFSSTISSKKFKLTKKLPLDYSELDSQTPLNEENFQYFFNNAYDSFGNYTFNEDGSVTYEFYMTEEENEQDNGTLYTANGSWEFHSNKIIVFWQPNFAFPSLKSQFNLIDIRNDEEYNLMLEGEGRKIFANFLM